MGRLSASLLALALGAVAAVALVSCGGGSDASLLPGNTASQITANLDQVKQLAESGECVGAQDAAQEVSTQIDALGGVDKRLKQSLREGAARLNEVVAECQVETTAAVAPASVPETTESTSTEPTTTEKKTPKEATTVTTETTPTTPQTTTSTPTTPTTAPTTPTTPTTTTPPPPTEGGGTGVPPGGLSPGEAGGSG